LLGSGDVYVVKDEEEGPHQACWTIVWERHLVTDDQCPVSDFFQCQAWWHPWV